MRDRLWRLQVCYAWWARENRCLLALLRAGCPLAQAEAILRREALGHCPRRAPRVSGRGNAR